MQKENKMLNFIEILKETLEIEEKEVTDNDQFRKFEV